MGRPYTRKLCDQAIKELDEEIAQCLRYTVNGYSGDADPAERLVTLMQARDAAAKAGRTAESWEWLDQGGPEKMREAIGRNPVDEGMPY